MISFFPTPYPDELWYSVICRYHIRSGNPCIKYTLNELYGTHYYNAVYSYAGQSCIFFRFCQKTLYLLSKSFLTTRYSPITLAFLPYPAKKVLINILFSETREPFIDLAFIKVRATNSRRCAIVHFACKKISINMENLIGTDCINYQKCQFVLAIVVGL